MAYHNPEWGVEVGRQGKDVVVAIAFTAFALVFIVEGRALPVTARGIPGPGLFPLLVAVTTILFALALLVQALVHRHTPIQAVGPADPAPDASDTLPDAATDVAPEEPRSVLRPMVLWAATLAASLAMPSIGFLSAMLLLSLVLLLGLERRFQAGSIAIAVTVPILLYILFDILLEVPLPDGFFS